MTGFRPLTALVLSLTLLLSSAAAAETVPVPSAAPDALPLPTETALTIHGYREGMAQAEQGGKWGFANPAGEIVIGLQYDSVVSFSLGMAAVEQEGKLGVIRPDGSYLIPPEYDSLVPLNCGMYLAQKGQNWGILSIQTFRDRTGRMTDQVWPMIYHGGELGTSGGLEAVILTPRTDGKLIVPLFRLPARAAELGIEGSQFPLTRGKLASFRDVSPRSWYALWVDLAYNVGLMSGVGDGLFEPERTVKVCEAIQIAANMDSRFLGDNFLETSHPGGTWYTPAVNYCLLNGILKPGQFDDYERAITRRELAQLFDATGLARSLSDRNDRSRIRTSVGDVSPADPAAPAIWDLYAKGILTGVDRQLNFRPDTSVSRAEAAAMAARLARPEQRLELSGI